MTAPARVRQPGRGVAEIVLREGRKRQVRRMFDAVGHRVTELERVAFGPLRLRGLAPGDSRLLSRADVEKLRRSTESTPDPRPAGRRKRSRRPRRLLMEESAPVRLRALRGATTVTENEAAAIVGATEELVREVMERNELRAEDLVSCIFTCTNDLDAEFPALAARQLGLDGVPLLCAREIDVPGVAAARDPPARALLRRARHRRPATSTSGRRWRCAAISRGLNRLDQWRSSSTPRSGRSRSTRRPPPTPSTASS